MPQHIGMPPQHMTSCLRRAAFERCSGPPETSLPARLLRGISHVPLGLSTNFRGSHHFSQGGCLEAHPSSLQDPFFALCSPAIHSPFNAFIALFPLSHAGFLQHGWEKKREGKGKELWGHKGVDHDG